ncbi:MAG: GTP-binding protein [Candidatus Thermoplasmatota archaeon]|nr:GTP-binding protein [Candidatus Thermoplasmatota archaeon]
MPVHLLVTGPAGPDVRACDKPYLIRCSDDGGMIVYILGGFLGSGKTTFLKTVTRHYLDSGKKVAILVNEMGDIGVDGSTLRSEGFKAVELPDGCICCTLTQSLFEAVAGIKEEIDPDVFIVEPTGLALPQKVRDTIVSTGTYVKDISIIGIVDVPRFDIFLERKKEFFLEQISESDIILVNKADGQSAEKVEGVLSFLKDLYDVPALVVSGKTLEGVDRFLEALR